MARIFVWTGAAGDGNYANAANWFNQTANLNPAATPPAAADTVLFPTGNGSLSGSGVAAILQFQAGSGPWTAGGTLSVGTLDAFVPLTITGLITAHAQVGLTANVTVDGTLDAGNGLIDSQAVFTVAGGGVVKAAQFNDDGASANLALQAGATLLLTGSGNPPLGLELANTGTVDAATLDSSAGQIDIDSPDGAMFTVRNASTVKALGTAIGGRAGQVGTLLLSGAGTVWSDLKNGSAATGNIVLGSGAAATGFLSVTAGASLNEARSAQLGLTVGSSGSATISGAASWSVAGDLIAADQGGANVTIESGATLTTGGTEDNIGASAGGTGTVVVDAVGSVWTAAGNIVAGLAGNGELMVSNGASVSAGAGLFVGGTVAGSGTVTVASGGSLSNHGSIAVIGNGLSAVGVATVTGIGSSWTDSGELNVGNAGDGTLTLADGGGFTTGGPIDVIGSSGGLGVVTVDGAGSHWSAPGQIAVGLSGTGTLAIGDQGTVNASREILVGVSAGSNGTLTISGGSTLTSGGTVAIIGSAAAAIGSATVDGVGSSWMLDDALAVGNSGSGSLTITNGGLVRSILPAQASVAVLSIGNNGAVGTLAPATGSVLVIGTNAMLDLGGNPMAIGAKGQGTLTVANGGSVEVGTPDSAIGAALSAGNLGLGSITVSGTGAILTIGGFASIGRGGTASLVVQAGGAVHIGLDPKGVGGLSIGAGSSSPGQPTGGAGLVAIGTGGTLFSAQAITVGGRGVSGTLSVAGGTVETATTMAVGVGGAIGGSGNGTVLIGGGGIVQIDGNGITSAGTAALSLASYAGSTATVDVVGAGAMLNTGSQSIAIGASGLGEMSVRQGGAVVTGTDFVTDAATTIGANSGAAGTLTIADATSTYRSVGQLRVGGHGAGLLLIENGGTALTGTASLTAQAGLATGWGSGGRGEIRVAGIGAELVNTGEFVVGGNGTAQPGGIGSLLIAGGGVVTTGLPVGGTGPAADIAAQAGSDGSSATVTGPASTWSIGGALIVGDLAQGGLNISAGGSVTATDLTIGNQTGAAGNLALSGAASTLAVSGQLTIGGSGVGDLSISNGGQLTATNLDIGLNAGASGVLDLQGNGSHVDVADTLNIGDAGTGVLILGSADETLTIGNALNLGAGGELIQFGGMIDPPNFTNHGTVHGAGGSATYGTLTNLGAYIAEGPYTLSAEFILGTGVLALADNGRFLLTAGTVVATQSVQFNNSTTFAVLTIGSIGGFGATISSFNDEAEIFVQGASIASTSFDAGSDVLSLFSGLGHSGTLIGELNVSSAVTGDALTELETANAQGGLGAVVPCFAAGTRIATDRGEVAVEALGVGDRVRTLSGGLAPVVWVGRRRVECRRHPKPRAVWPVRVAAGTFGAGRPGRDLFLSPDHALWFEGEGADAGVLIPVRYLIDGDSIAQVAMDAVTYYHVELPRHDVLLAEGVAAESYLDTGDRSSFANGGGAVALHADFSSLRWEAEGYAPLVVTGVQVERVRARVADRNVAVRAA